MYHAGLAHAHEWNFFAYCYQPELYSRNTTKITMQCFKRAVGEDQVILKAIQALHPLHDYMYDHFAFKTEVTARSSLNSLFKKHCDGQSSLVQDSPRNQLHYFSKGK